MNKFFSSSLFLIFGSLSLSPLLAAESLEHFVTKDGRHYCSVFMKNEFKSCDTFGITYEGDKVVAGEKPFFSAGFPNIVKIVIESESFCVEGTAIDTGREVEMEKCSNISPSETPSSEIEPVLLDEVSNDLDQVVPAEGDALSNEADTYVVSGEMPSDDFQAATTISNELPVTSKCSVNGEEVDCEKMMEGATSMVKKGLGILGIIIMVVALFGVFSLWMLIHALSNPIPNKVLWALFIFFIFPLGAIIYFFVIQRNFAKAPVPPGGNPGNVQGNQMAPSVTPVSSAAAFFPEPNPGVIGAYTPTVVPPPVEPTTLVVAEAETAGILMPVPSVTPVVTPVVTPLSTPVTPTENIVSTPVVPAMSPLVSPTIMESVQTAPEVSLPTAMPPLPDILPPSTLTQSIPTPSPVAPPTTPLVPPSPSLNQGPMV